MKVLIAASITADGFIGAHEGHNSRDWRIDGDGRLFSRLVKSARVMVIGSTTYGTFRIKRAPFGQRLIVYTHHSETITGENVEPTDKAPSELVAQLESEGYKSLIVAGGARVNSLFLHAGLVDELYLTVHPTLFGQGIRLLSDETSRQLTLLECTSAANGLVTLHYALAK